MCCEGDDPVKKSHSRDPLPPNKDRKDVPIPMSANQP